MSSLIYEDRVKKEWIDYNGHMSEAFYVLVFGYATDTFLDRAGLDADYRTREQVSAYTVEAHIRYLNQARVGDPLRVNTLLVNFDEKRVRLFHTMRLGQDGADLASEELLLLSVDTRNERVRPFEDAVMSRLQRLAEDQAAVERPKDLGRAISL